MSDVAADNDRVAVLVPTYNEAENVAALAERVLAADPRLELLIVDDASPDGTGVLAGKLAENEPRIHVLNRTGPRGYARASAEGLEWCGANGFTTVCTMDGDLSHDPARLCAMLAARDAGADVVIGSRYVEGGGVEAQWGPIRRAVSEGGSRYARAMIGTKVHDCTSGFRCYGPRALQTLALSELRSDGYSFLIEVLAQLCDAGLDIEEVPIVYTDRQHGASKISRRIVLEALGQTTLLGVRRFYAEHGEKLRYLVIGMWNTAFSYMLFWLFLRVLGPHLYIVASVLAWICAVVQSTVTMKFLVFRRPGRLVHQVLRAYVIYLPALGLSTLILWTGVSVLHLNPLVAQLAAILVTTVFSYIGHKYFTFRVPLETGEVVSEELLD